MVAKEGLERPDNTIDRPIFVIGCGRSGSTLLYNMLCVHSDLAWFSNFTARFPKWLYLAKLSKLYPLRLKYNFPNPIIKVIPKPSEGYELWDFAKPVSDSPSDPPLGSQDADVADGARIRRIICKHMTYQQKPRFINKNTRNTRRIEYLNVHFPDALFIHIVRDPRAVVASLLKVDWFPDLKLWNHDLLTPADWSAQGNDPAILAAELWRDETKLVLDNVENLSGRYFRIHYEDFISKPKGTLQLVLDFCGLKWSEDFSALIELFKIKDMNYKYKVDLSLGKQDKINAITASTFNSMEGQVS